MAALGAGPHVRRRVALLRLPTRPEEGIHPDLYELGRERRAQPVHHPDRERHRSTSASGTRTWVVYRSATIGPVMPKERSLVVRSPNTAVDGQLGPDCDHYVFRPPCPWQPAAATTEASRSHRGWSRSR